MIKVVLLLVFAEVLLFLRQVFLWGNLYWDGCPKDKTYRKIRADYRYYETEYYMNRILLLLNSLAILSAVLKLGK